MSTPKRPFENSSPPRSFSDDNTGLLIVGSLISLPATTISQPENSLQGQLSSSPNVSDDSIRLSSPSVRALTRQSTANQIHGQQSQHGASSQINSILGSIVKSTKSNPSPAGHPNRPFVSPHTTATVRGSASTRADSLASFPKPSLGFSSVKIRKSKRPVSRKRATPTKLLQRNQCQRRFNSLAEVKPFEKLAALEVKLRDSPQSLRLNDELRRVQLAIALHSNTKSSLARRSSLHKDGLAQQDLVRDIKDLGLGQVVVVEDRQSCSFCMFECNYGSSNAKVLLPASGSSHRCLDCQPTRVFDDAYESKELSEMSFCVSSLEGANKPTSKYRIRE